MTRPRAPGFMDLRPQGEETKAQTGANAVEREWGILGPEPLSGRAAEFGSVALPERKPR